MSVAGDAKIYGSAKIVTVGSGGSGKTTFMTRHLTGDFTKVYSPTIGVDVNWLWWPTSKGVLKIQMWDCAGNDNFRGLNDGYWIAAAAAIVFFDVTVMDSFKAVPDYIKALLRTCGSIPIVLCGNKVDVRERKVKSRIISKLIRDYSGQTERDLCCRAAVMATILSLQSLTIVKDVARLIGRCVWDTRGAAEWDPAEHCPWIQIRYFDVSCKTNYNFEKPFLYLAQKLVAGDGSI